VPELVELEGTGVFYGASAAEAKALAGRRAFIVGGGNSAGQAAMHLARFAERVTILVRGSSLAESMSSYLREEIEAAENIDVRFGTEVAGGRGHGRLEELRLRDTGSGGEEEVAAAALFVMIGARPATAWLPEEIARDDWGYVLTGHELGRARGDDAESEVQMLATGVPGVFAVGDVRRGGVKRVASAVGEGSIVIQQVHRHIQAIAKRSGTVA
jgi:thioredoxin reductase (NADPH)